MDDSISRQAVKELAHKQVREKYCGMSFKKHRDFYIKLADSIIDLLPSAQPEPKRGKWESQSGGGYCCSECGRYAMDKADGRIVMISVKSKFCPHCGAKMEVNDGN